MNVFTPRMAPKHYSKVYFLQCVSFREYFLNGYIIPFLKTTVRTVLKTPPVLPHPPPELLHYTNILLKPLKSNF